MSTITNGRVISWKATNVVWFESTTNLSDVNDDKRGRVSKLLS